MKKIIYLSILLMAACRTKNTEKLESKDTLVQQEVIPTHAEEDRSNEFTDSSTYRPDKNIYLTIKADSLVSISLFQKVGHQFILLQRIDSLETQFANVIPTFEDFNQDGINDLNLPFGSGGRGGNSFSYAYLQNKETGRLSLIEESGFIPNLHYDTSRHVITSVALYAGTTFLDYKLKGNKLVQLNGVDVSTDNEWTYREYYTFDQAGKQHIYKRDSINDKGEGILSRE